MFKRQEEYSRRARIADRLNRTVLWTVTASGYAAALFVGTTAGIAAQQPNECLRACTEARAVLNDASIMVPVMWIMGLACIAVVWLVVLALRAERSSYTYRSRANTQDILRAAGLQ